MVYLIMSALFFFTLGFMTTMFVFKLVDLITGSEE